MTHNTKANLTKLTKQAKVGHHVCYIPHSYEIEPIVGIDISFDWRSMLQCLFAEWKETSAEIRGVSFLFTDAPYHLSEFIFDAIVVWDGTRFSRLEADLLPTAFRAALEAFAYDVRIAILCSVGDAVAAMADVYSHQLLSGQAYLTLETLTVMNIHGRSMSWVKELTPTLPYAVTALLTGSWGEVVARHPECAEPGGVFTLVDWTTNDQKRSRVAQNYLETCFRKTTPRLSTIPFDAEDFEEIRRGGREMLRADGSGA